jgi:predicted small integral membrane protein
MRARLGLAVAFLGAVALVAVVDTGHLRWAVRLIEAVPNGDKVGHFSVFGGLAFLTARIAPGRRVFRRAAGYAAGGVPLGVLALLLGAGLEELSQAWIPVRHCDPWDFLADALGIAVATWLALRRARGPRPKAT